MGWFSRKKSEAKIVGAKAGQTAKAQIVRPFNLTKFFEGGEFSPPLGFFHDPYVVGFLQSMITTLGDVGSAQRGKSWSETEKQELMLAAIEAIVAPSEIREFIAQPRKHQDTQDYKDAYLAANTYVKAIYAYNVLTTDNPVVVEATKLVEERKGFLVEMFPEGGDKEFLVWAVPEVSIMRHIEETYLNN